MGINFPLWSPSIGDVSPSAFNGAFSVSAIKNTNITTSVGGTLTAAGLVGGQISRTGPTAAYSDTTDTAAAIITALGGTFESGATFIARIKNLVPYPQTITGGTGVTWSAVAIIPGFGVGSYFGTVGGTQASPTISFSHIITESYYQPEAGINPIATALTTVGAGTITAAGLVSGMTLRSGSTAAFTDTTDTAPNIIAAGAGTANAIGSSWLHTYVNNTVAPATITGSVSGGTVTVSGVTVVPPNSWATYLITYTAATTLTMVGIAQGFIPRAGAGSGTFTANGATAVTVTDATITATSVVVTGLKTANSPGGAPWMFAVTAGTSFQMKATAGDNSVYNYTILG